MARARHAPVLQETEDRHGYRRRETTCETRRLSATSRSQLSQFLLLSPSGVSGVFGHQGVVFGVKYVATQRVQ
eukprot:4712687-Prymnesium_polylepis.2